MYMKAFWFSGFNPAEAEEGFSKAETYITGSNIDSYLRFFSTNLRKNVETLLNFQLK